MIDNLLLGWANTAFGWRDAIDILIMSILIYEVGMLIRGTRAMQSLIGVVVVVLAYWVTAPGKPMYLMTVHRILGNVLFYAPFAIIVLFQTAIRRTLARLGRTPLLRLHNHEMTQRMIDDVVRCAAALAARPTGALIVVEGDQALRDQVESGVRLDSEISYDLLMSIFTPGTLLHDGAAIVGDGRIRAASCFLQVTSDPRLSREYGSRHRAAIGLTEEYDCLVVVVSEERGEIRVATEGRFSPTLDAEGLRALLTAHVHSGAPRRAAGSRATRGGSAGGHKGSASRTDAA